MLCYVGCCLSLLVCVFDYSRCGVVDVNCGFMLGCCGFCLLCTCYSVCLRGFIACVSFLL